MKKAVIFLAFLLAACATTGTPYPQAVAGMPVLKKNESRLYVYRDSSLGFAMHPSIFLDGKKIGDSVPGAFIVVKVTPGRHTVSATTETETRLSFTAVGGQETYIRTSADAGLVMVRMEFSQQEPETARKDLQDLLQQEAPHA